MVKLNLEWKAVGWEAIGSAPQIPLHECELGTDAQGVIWLCRAKYRYAEKKYLVAFDYETEEQSAFLKSEVIDAPNYWSAHRRVYHSKFVDYEDIEKTIRAFIIEQGIDHKDVAGHKVI